MISEPGQIRLALMKKLSCTEYQWNTDQNVVTKLYVGRICPVLEYGMAASSTTAKSNSSKLSRVQHQAMRTMTDNMHSIPISAMEMDNKSVTGSLWGWLSINNNNNDHTEKRSLRLFTISLLHQELSQTHMLNRPGCNPVQITCHTAGAHHAQHVMCQVVQRDSSAIHTLVSSTSRFTRLFHSLFLRTLRVIILVRFLCMWLLSHCTGSLIPALIIIIINVIYIAQFNTNSILTALWVMVHAEEVYGENCWWMDP